MVTSRKLLQGNGRLGQLLGGGRDRNSTLSQLRNAANGNGQVRTMPGCVPAA